jgi:hypothetical protein
MTTIQKRIIIAGIKIKVARGENLESILEIYINLTPEEKKEIRIAIMGV